MTLSLEPVQVATGCDEEGMLVFDHDRRLLAVLTHLSVQHEQLSGHWFLEAGFGRVDGPTHPTFVDLEAAQDWIHRRIARSRP
jgi:hypothetical protein